MKNLKPVLCLAVFGACLSPQFAHTARADEASAIPDSAVPEVARLPRISLEFYREASVVDILRLAARQADVRLILDEEVSGTLPKFALQDVTGKQAIQTIARMAKLSFMELDDQTFVVGKTDERAIAAAKNEIAANKAKAQAELLKPRVNISRTMKLSIDVRATKVQDVLQQIADEAGFKLIFLDSPGFVISRLQMQDVSPEAAIQWVATMAKLNAIPMTFRESGKDVPGFLIRNNQPSVPLSKNVVPQSPRDKAQEVDPMIVTPPRDRTYSGLLPMPKSVPLPEANGSMKPQNDSLRNVVPQNSIPQNAAPQK